MRSPYFEEKTYSIIRFRKNGENEVIHRGLTRDEAKAHCQNKETEGEDFFDGFQEE